MGLLEMQWIANGLHQLSAKLMLHFYLIHVHTMYKDSTSLENQNIFKQSLIFLKNIDLSTC